MTIDFEKIEGMIPEGGEVVLKLVRKGKGMQVWYTRKGKGAAVEAPLRLEGSADELTEDFERLVTEVGPLERMIDNNEVIEKRKKDLASSVKGGDKKKVPAKSGDEEAGSLFEKTGGKK